MNDKTHSTSQYLDNISYDEGLDIQARMPVEFDGATIRRGQSKLVAQNIQKSGTDTFICVAPIGSATSQAVWQCKKIDVNGNTTWADADAGFDNIADNSTTLIYG